MHDELQEPHSAHFAILLERLWLLVRVSLCTIARFSPFERRFRLGRSMCSLRSGSAGACSARWDSQPIRRHISRATWWQVERRASNNTHSFFDPHIWLLRHRLFSVSALSLFARFRSSGVMWGGRLSEAALHSTPCGGGYGTLY